jgi:mono/diheme cytochrome c family protein
MSDQESVRTYEASFPEMPQGAIPIQGGLQVWRERDPEDLTNPLPFDKASVKKGKGAYGYFCVMCHGPKADGNGTVGQSFYPLPANLREDYVQGQSDGEIFYTITFGYQRHPPLGDTAAERDRWAIVHYIRSLGRDPEG